MGLGGSDEGGGGVLCSCNTEKSVNVYIARRSFVRPVHTSYYVGGRLSNGASWGVCFSHLSESRKVSGRPSATLVGSLFRGGCVRDAML